MARRRDETEFEPAVAFRPLWQPVQDRVIAEHARGFVENLAPEGEQGPGAVPPPVPKKLAPRESLRERLEGS
jgi:hypothetical protein